MELFFSESSKSKDEQDPLIEDDEKLSNLIEEGKPVLSLVPLRRQNGERVSCLVDSDDGARSFFVGCGVS